MRGEFGEGGEDIEANDVILQDERRNYRPTRSVERGQCGSGNLVKRLWLWRGYWAVECDYRTDDECGLPNLTRRKRT